MSVMPRKRLQDLCAEKKLDYAEIVGPYKGRVISYYRRHIILQMSEEFPKLSTPQLAKLFNRDHSSIVVARQQANQEKIHGVTNEWLRSYLSTAHFISSSPARLIVCPRP